MHGFTQKALAQELAGKGVTVNTVSPKGYIGTDMVRAIKPEILEKIVATIPVKRLGTPERLAPSSAGWLAMMRALPWRGLFLQRWPAYALKPCACTRTGLRHGVQGRRHAYVFCHGCHLWASWQMVISTFLLPHCIFLTLQAAFIRKRCSCVIMKLSC